MYQIQAVVISTISLHLVHRSGLGSRGIQHGVYTLTEDSEEAQAPGGGLP